jgi:hypothetical protein
MEKQLEEAVKRLADKAKEAGSGPDAMHYSQAALNAANALMTLKHREKA